MSKVIKIGLVAFAFLAISLFLLLSFFFFSLSSSPSLDSNPRRAQAPEPLPATEPPANTDASEPDPRATPMAARETSPRATYPPGVQIAPGPASPGDSSEVRTPTSAYDEEVWKRMREERVARDRELAYKEKETVTAAPSKVGDVIDQILAQMDFGNIAFNSPDRMKLNSPSAIQLVVSPTETIERLKESIVAEGHKHGEQIRISDTMEARLTGTAFQIGAITPELQALTAKEVTNWKWEVRPTQYGRHNLHLTLSAVVTLKGSSVPRTIRTFERTIEVEVSSWQRTFLVFRENWEWMSTLVAFPILGWWLKRRHVKKSRTTLPASEEGSVLHKGNGALQPAVTGESEQSLPTESATAPVICQISELETGAGSTIVLPDAPTKAS